MKQSRKLYSLVMAVMLLLTVQICFASIISGRGDNDGRRSISKPTLHSLVKARSVKLSGLRGYNWVQQSKLQSFHLQPISHQRFQVNATLQFTKGNTSYQVPQQFTLKVPRFKASNKAVGGQRF